MFTESLTVRILGDSSDLQGEIESVASELEELGSRISGMSGAGEEIGRGLGRASAGVAPLQQVSTLLNQISRQCRQLGQQPITLNVRPAIAALQQLSAMIQAVAAQLMALGGGFGMGGGGGFTPQGPAPVRGPGFELPGFANGGFVEGPAGFDQVPARLSAGEFVMSRESTRRLGTTFLSALNSGRPTMGKSAGPILPSSAVPQPQTTNHFGGITIQVTEAVDINDVMRDLRLQGAAIRNRRG